MCPTQHSKPLQVQSSASVFVRLTRLMLDQAKPRMSLTKHNKKKKYIKNFFFPAVGH